MKIVPVLAITNALALALAIFVYVKQGDAPAGPRRAEASSPSAAEIAELRAEIEALKQGQPARAHAPEAGVQPGAAPSATAPGAAETPLASRPPEEDAAAPEAPEEFDAQEMVTFRKKVRKANELNSEEDQENGIKDGIDRLVRDNKIAPLTPAQKDGVAKIVLGSRRKGADVFRRMRESGAFEGGNREDRGTLIRTEIQNIRAETQRQLEEIMPAADAKTYLDETTRDMGRFGGFGGAGGPLQAPVPTTPGR